MKQKKSTIKAALKIGVRFFVAKSSSEWHNKKLDMAYQSSKSVRLKSFDLVRLEVFYR